MVRTYIAKTGRAHISEDAIQRALHDLLNGNSSVRKAAADHGISKSMLHKRLKKIKDQDVQNPELPATPIIRGTSKYSSMQVFSKQEEDMLEDYLIQSSKMQYGLTYKQIRDFAYSYAVKVSDKIPTSWEEKRTAGIDWMKGFMCRHPRLSLRKPENTSLARNMNFNKQNVDSFFENLGKVTSRYKFPHNRIFNIDESGITTVLQSPKVVAPVGVKQVGQTVSAERGELVTICAIVNALGNTIPPAYVFPRVFFKEAFLVGAPTGSIGFASRSGWMTQDIFVDVVKHIQKHTSSSKENPILVLLDNHESHISIDLINFCRNHGVVLLTFPPHTSHRLQPLDVGVFSPFKNNCKAEFNLWISQNPGKTISIYHVAGLTSKAYDTAFTRTNILSGFRKTGIVPFNNKVFNDDDFAASVVTDQPLPPTPSIEDDSNKLTEILENAAPGISEPELDEGPSQIISRPTLEINSPIRSGESTNKIITPEQVRPFPKSQPKKVSCKGRKKGKTCILTDTPEKDRIEEETKTRKERKEAKLVQSCKRKLGLEQIKQEGIKRKKKCMPTKIPQDISDSESNGSIDYDNEGLSPLILSDESGSDDDGEEVEIDGLNININDFVLVKLCGKKSVKHYVAQISEKTGQTEFTVNFFKKKDLFGSFKFVRPDVPDTSNLDILDLVFKLPQPKIVGGTERAVSIFTFKFNFSDYNMG